MIEKRYEVQKWIWYKNEWCIIKSTIDLEAAKNELDRLRDIAPEYRYRIEMITMYISRKVYPI